MIGVPMNANSIYIPMIQTGCCQAEFDSTYPVHLNDIIHQDEFRASIERINRAVFAGGIKKFIVIIFVLNIIASMALFIFGGISVSYSRTYGFPPLIGFGMGLCIVGSFFFITGLIIVQIRQTTRLRQVVGEESMNYSVRSPTPCSWRLETTRHYFGGYGNNNTQLAYHLVIDIGRPTGSGNAAFCSYQTVNQASYINGQLQQQQQSQYPPPPYTSSSTTFCPQCGTTRQDLSARFCSSCGQAFNKN